MPKAKAYGVNPRVDPLILEAAQRLADVVVQPAIEDMATTLCDAMGVRPSVVAAAISETLYRLVLREDTTRWLAAVAEDEGLHQEHAVGVVETRSAIGRLAGCSRQVIEQRLGLVGRVRRGRPRPHYPEGWTPQELADAVIVTRALQLAVAAEARTISSDSPKVPTDFSPGT